MHDATTSHSFMRVSSKIRVGSNAPFFCTRMETQEACFHSARKEAPTSFHGIEWAKEKVGTGLFHPKQIRKRLLTKRNHDSFHLHLHGKTRCASFFQPTPTKFPTRL